mgnify:CR=1 FL=1
MNRAFVKESDDEFSAGELPERPVPEHANYVTPQGMDQLRTRVRELADQHEQLKVISADNSEARRKLREVERDQRYFNTQLERAELVDPAQQPHGEVRFGATVEVEDADGGVQEFSIVGDDEADVAAGRISWDSPLARSLLGARSGDTVKWQRPAGATEVEIIAIRYRAG